MPMASEDTPKQAMMFVVVRSGRTTKRSLERRLAGVLLSVVHLLEELLCLLFVHERQPCQAFLQLEGVKEDAILVVAPCVEYFLVPYHSSVSGLDSVSLLGIHGGRDSRKVGPSVCLLTEMSTIFSQ